uniref:NR LBD domain-containing protein n=1 Tax=Meloidogyne javanica TaxID=6303 RepID=A0A915N2W3_MELJA
MDVHKLDNRVKNEIIILEKQLHPECEDTFVKRLNELAPPISHLRIFVGAWRPLRRYNCVVDRGGQEVNYIVDYLKDEESMLKVQQKGWKLSNFVDRMWIRYFRFKRNFLDRDYVGVGVLKILIKVWDLVDTSCSLIKPKITTNSGVHSSNNQIQKDIPFEEAFKNPTLICGRYPLMFNRADQPLTPFLYIDGWKRHFTYFSDWVHQLELFQRMSFNDQILLAKQRIIHVGWLVHAYNSQLKGAGAIFHSLFEPLRQLNLDFAEYVLLKAILLFREEVGLSPQALEQVKNARSLYLRALFK